MISLSLKVPKELLPTFVSTFEDYNIRIRNNLHLKHRNFHICTVTSTKKRLDYNSFLLTLQYLSKRVELSLAQRLETGALASNFNKTKSLTLNDLLFLNQLKKDFSYSSFIH